MENLKIEYLPVDSLTPYERNTRKHQEKDISNIAKSIQQYGMNDAVGIWGEKNIIVEGHGRVLACKQLGITEVPCVRLDHLTDKQRREYAIAHNATAELSEWDFDVLPDELADLDLSCFDFDLDLGEDPDTTETVEDDPPEMDPVGEPFTKQGDIWQLGRHRLMCGDSTDPSDVSDLMAGAQADLVVTDPPYNVAIENSQGMTIQNDDMGEESFLQFLTDAFKTLEASLKPGGAFYVWFASREHINFETALNRAGLQVRQELIWNKNAMIMGRQDYQWKHEPCLYGWKEGAAHYFTDDRTQTTVIEDKGLDLKKMKKGELLQLLEEIFSDKVSTTVINEDKPAKNDLHPTMKPIKLLARQVRNSSRPGEKVLDLFGGSGSTLVTCEQTGRVCFMMEYDPRYADVIIERWEALTGKKAQIISDSEQLLEWLVLFLYSNGDPEALKNTGGD